MKKHLSLIKYILIPAILLLQGIYFGSVFAEAESRYEIANDLLPEYIWELCEDNGKLYLPLNETIYYEADGGYNDASYRLETSDRSIVDITKGVVGKKKGTAVLTLRKYQDGKYSVLYQTQVVVGQPRYYTREENLAIGSGLPPLKDPDVLLGCQYLDPKYTYAYRIYDTSLIKKIGTDIDLSKNKYDVYEAVKYGSTKADIVEIYNGKETVIDTITINVRRPVLVGDGTEIIHSMSHAEDFWEKIDLDYHNDEELIYESDDPSILYKKYKEPYQLKRCGTTYLHVYCMIDGEKYHAGTVKVTIVP